MTEQRTDWRAVERVTVRFAGYGAYVLGIGGAAVWLGSPWGWVALAVAGGVPGFYMLRRDLDDRSVERDRDRLAPAAARPTGPAPEPIGGMPPEVPSAYPN